MHEVKKPKKNLAYYYLIVLIVIMLFNAFVYPYIIEQQVKEVDYGTFMSMTEKGKIGQDEIQSNQIMTLTGRSGCMTRARNSQVKSCSRCHRL